MTNEPNLSIPNIHNLMIFAQYQSAIGPLVMEMGEVVDFDDLINTQHPVDSHDLVVGLATRLKDLYEFGCANQETEEEDAG